MAAPASPTYWCSRPRSSRGGAEPVAAPDGGRITVSRGILSHPRPPQVSVVVKTATTRT